MNTLDLIRPLDFCLVTSKKLDGSTLSRGDEVLVGTVKSVPAKKSDPYLQRIYLGVHKVVEDQADLSITIIVDPRSLAKVSKERQDELMQKMEEKFEKSQS